MTWLRSCLAALVCAAAAHAQDENPLLTRPVTLPRGSVDLTLHGTYSNWYIGPTTEVPSTWTGGTFALAVDFGVTDSLQLGLAAAFPISPAHSFGSVIGSALVAVDGDAAVRFDAGLERVGLNGSDLPLSSTHSTRYFGGIGARLRFPVLPTIAFVVGRAGAVEFGAFNNVGDGQAAYYTGASMSPAGSADLVAISGGDAQTPTRIAVSVPAGFLVQPHPAVAVTIQSGYALTTLASNTSSSASGTPVSHYVPLDVELAVSTPLPALELGTRLLFSGCVGQSGMSGREPGYFDQRSLMFWLRLRA